MRKKSNVSAMSRRRVMMKQQKRRMHERQRAHFLFWQGSESS
ncbi:hypothetical protein [Shewanella maritima]